MRSRPNTGSSRLLGTLLLALATSSVGAGERRVVSLPGTDVGLPFSPAVATDELLHLSGALGNRPGTLELADGIEAQMRRTMDNLGAVLKAEGMDFSHVVSTNVYLADARDFGAMNAVYREYFPKDPPTRATVEGDIAIPGALVEVSMIAARPGVPRRVVRPEGMASPANPFSWGVEAGGTLFVAGATSRDPATFEPVPGDVATQTRRVLDNVGQVLRAAELDYSNVAHCNVFLADARDFGAMNAVYREYFRELPPTRATVRARLMRPAFTVEIQCTAVRGERLGLSVPGEKPPSSPYSPGIAVGDRVYLSGFVGRGAEGYAPGDVSTQTAVTLDRMESTLATVGLDFGDVVEATVYLTDIRHYAAMNAVYAERVSRPPPARATVGTPLMSPDALVEIRMVAVRSERSSTQPTSGSAPSAR